jgi:hypothetical protein
MVNFSLVRKLRNIAKRLKREKVKGVWHPYSFLIILGFLSNNGISRYPIFSFDLLVKNPSKKNFHVIP